MTTASVVCAARVPRVPRTAAQQQQLSDKTTASATFAAWLRGGVTPNVPPPCCTSAGDDWRLDSVTNMYIWKEGDGKAYWTCGPGFAVGDPGLVAFSCKRGQRARICGGRVTVH